MMRNRGTSSIRRILCPRHIFLSPSPESLQSDCVVNVATFSLARFPVPPDSASVPMSSSISSIEQDPLILYSKTLHDYTLKLWTESRRVAEEKARRKLARMDLEEEARKQSRNPPTTQRPHRP
ncbi:hypothetical protein EV702DRAFT_1058055 [Suillus placidus]|uniref:Uncharacterized protein n=1 Tax=Suillus placidus TaxID=48579 RepID=A0A9P7A841_9AGAM|nr:hypothetical protein EV702DRAFT_1058055 [Suillus placidus]